MTYFLQMAASDGPITDIQKIYHINKFIEIDRTGKKLVSFEACPLRWMRKPSNRQSENEFDTLWPNSENPTTILELARSYATPKGDWTPHRCISVGTVTYKEGKDTFDRALTKAKKLRKGEAPDSTDYDQKRRR